MLPSLSYLGIRTEFVLNAGNCSIESYRALWYNPDVSVPLMVQLARDYNISG